MKEIATALAARAQPLDIFFRNDDAGWSQDALDPLLDLFAERAMPIDLAVIPAALEDKTAKRLTQWCHDHPGIGLHQHGYAHLNHEPAGSRKCEFGAARPHDRQLADIVAGRMRLLSLLGTCDPIFTPPWNRCAAATAEALNGHGFELVSDDGALAKSGCAAPCLAIAFDWERHRREGHLLPKLALHVSNTAAPLGIMLHHEAMDKRARETLGEFLSLLSVTSTAKTSSMRRWIGKS